MEKIELSGLVSTCAVMDWIEQNGCPNLYCQTFYFPDDPIRNGFFEGCAKAIVVSKANADDFGLKLLLMRHPVEQWHHVTPTQQRYYNNYGWYAYIGGKFYWMTV